MFAGLDTVALSLSCLLAWLAKHPDARRSLVAEPELISAAIEELMRVEAPVQGTHRYATADFELAGVPVYQGDRIHVMWAGANLDGSAFENPLEVDFWRPSNRHIAFASGFHRCLGSHLARQELRCALEEFSQPDSGITPLRREKRPSTPTSASAPSTASLWSSEPHRSSRPGRGADRPGSGRGLEAQEVMPVFAADFAGYQRGAGTP
jgi:cytochrome P450